MATVIFPLFLLCITIQLGYALYFFGQVFTNSKPSTNSQFPIPNSPLSVIICARNEASNLQLNLPSILAQRYCNDSGVAMYEVIVVNDASGDNTADVLVSLQQQHSNLHVITVSDNETRTLPGKKYALSKGIAAAKHEYLVLTDADCTPASGHWLAAMAQPLHEGKELVAGYGKYTVDNGWLNVFIRWETLHTFLQYSTYAMAGKPYMAVGRNLACTKAAIQKAQQHSAWGKLPSGDDDLLVNAVAMGNNMAIVSTPEAFTISEPKRTVSEWVQQKQRHLSTGKYYKTGTQFLLGLYALSHSATWVLCGVLLFSGLWIEALGAMLCRCVVYYIIWHRTAKQLDEKLPVICYPLMDIGWMLYNFAFSPYIVLKNKKQWT